MKSIPVEPLIIISNSSTIIETASDPSHYYQITRSINIDSKIEQFKLKYGKEIFAMKELWHLAMALVKGHTPGRYDPLKHFKLIPNDLLKVVHCPKCSLLPVVRQRGSWKCSICKHHCKKTHIHALQDYRLLIRDTLTAREMCDFLCLPSRHVALRIFRSWACAIPAERKVGSIISH